MVWKSAFACMSPSIISLACWLSRVRRCRAEPVRRWLAEDICIGRPCLFGLRRGRLEIIWDHLGHDRFRLRIDVRQEGLRIHADPEYQKDQRSKLPGFPRIQIAQALVCRIRYLPEEDPLVQPQHVGSSQDYPDR